MGVPERDGARGAIGVDWRTTRDSAPPPGRRDLDIKVSSRQPAAGPKRGRFWRNRSVKQWDGCGARSDGGAGGCAAAAVAQPAERARGGGGGGGVARGGGWAAGGGWGGGAGGGRARAAAPR